MTNFREKKSGCFVHRTQNECCMNNIKMDKWEDKKFPKFLVGCFKVTRKLWRFLKFLRFKKKTKRDETKKMMKNNLWKRRTKTFDGKKKRKRKKEN